MVPQLNRLLWIFGFLVLAYFILRWVAKPESFYWYGHYRGKALEEVADLPIHYAPVDACDDCHSAQAEQKKAGPHHSISCQSCHDPGFQHVNDPSSDNIVRPATDICTLCHTANYARPASFPQVNVAEHASGMNCTDCHLVHNPEDFQ